MEIEQFKSEFRRLRNEWEQLLAEVEAENRQKTPDFNIFYLLGVTRNEVKTHSAILANLLDPEGEHAQKHLFLNYFLEMCRDKFPNFIMPRGAIEDAAWNIKRETSFSDGRMDIVIRSPSLRYILVIENKISSGIDELQLMRYAIWLEEQDKYYTDRVLILLTPTGERARVTPNIQTIGNPEFNLIALPSDLKRKVSCFPISYHGDIDKWLSECLGQIKSPRLKETLMQYLNLIPAL